MRGWQGYLLFSAFAVGFCAFPVRADIYMYRDTRGLLHFSNAPSEPQFQYYLPDIANWKNVRTGRIDGARRRAFMPYRAPGLSA